MQCLTEILNPTVTQLLLIVNRISSLNLDMEHRAIWHPKVFTTSCSDTYHEPSAFNTQPDHLRSQLHEQPKFGTIPPTGS